jgi:hypothetical protein
MNRKEQLIKIEKRISEIPLDQFNFLPEKFRKQIIAFYKLLIVVEVLNEKWIPDWTNYSEYKYYPWFEFEKDATSQAGVAARYSFSGFDIALSFIVSRLCFKNRELAIYASTQFIDLYNDYLLG